MSKQILKDHKKSETKIRVCNSVSEDAVLAESAGIDGSLWQLCLQLLDRKSPEWSDLQDLADNAAGDNPFYEPSFLLAIRGKMVRSSEYHLILFETIGNEKKAKLAFPVIQAKLSGDKRYLKAFENEYAPLASPLVDKNNAEKNVLKFTELLSEAVEKHEISLRMQSVCDASLFSKHFAKIIQERDKNSKAIFKKGATFKRACLLPEKAKSGGLTSLTSKRVRELARLEKKLEEIGNVRFETVTDKMDVLLRFEEFLLLEMKGWKGRKGTSMQLLKKTSAFARMAVTEMADLGRAEIFSLRLDERSIATIIMFKGDGRYYPWKIAFDEDYAHRSPGSILMHATSKAILNRNGFKSADSLAKPGKSWMTAIWNEEQSFSEFVIGPDADLVENISKSGMFKSKLKNLIKKVLKIK